MLFDTHVRVQLHVHKTGSFEFSNRQCTVLASGGAHLVQGAGLQDQGIPLVHRSRMAEGKVLVF
jgi:hypothetical protein